MTLDERQLLQTLIRHQAKIDSKAFGDIHAAFPAGSRRRKPVCWIEKAVLSRMINNEWLVPAGAFFTVAPATLTRMRGSREGADYAAQHRDMSNSDIYMPDGTKRPARINHRVSALRRIGRRTGAGGQPLLSAAQIEAGEQFARDYDRGGMGFVRGQSFDSAVVDGGAGHSAAEEALISRMDRRRRVSEAISCLGPGLDRVLIAVCCENWSLEQIERSEKWAKHTGRTVLAMALDRLVAFYGTRPGE